MSYGVEMMATDNPDVALESFGLAGEAMGISSDNISYPEDTNSVRWYKQTFTNYYQYDLGRNYDVIKLTAVSWDDTSDWLHVNSLTTTNTNQVSYAASLALNSYLALVEVVVGESIPGSSVAVTMAEVIQ